ncbi:hypothetical protein ACS0TY_034506 [Phlomoides rotata]
MLESEQKQGNNWSWRRRERIFSALDGSGPPAMLDAPVSGGILSAENGTLIFMFKEKTYSRDQIVDEMRVEWAECIQREI